MTPELAARVAALGADNRSGASSLAVAAVGILRDALAEGPAAAASAAVALCAAQAAMAPVWNAAALALRRDGGAALDRFARRIERAPAAVARVAADALLAGRGPGQPFAVGTVSASGTVRACLGELSRRCRLHVLCAEGRPLLEGRALAASLAADGVAVTLCTDAAAGGLSAAADAVLVGADAVGPDWFANKCGTRPLVEAAAARGRPAYVAAARDKFIAAPLAARLTPGGGAAAEVWADAPPGVAVANPYFERVPAEAVAGVVTDVGVVEPGALAAVAAGLLGPDDVRRLAARLDGAGRPRAAGGGAAGPFDARGRLRLF